MKPSSDSNDVFLDGFNKMWYGVENCNVRLMQGGQQ